MGAITLIADHLFDGETLHAGRPLTIEDGQVRALDSVAGAKEIRLQGLLAPGFIDVQVNGGGGVLFNNTPTLAGLQAICDAHARYGSTALLPTLITDNAEIMQRAADAVAEALRARYSAVIGVHFEGPHLSVARRGVHSTEYIRPISAAEWAVFERRDLGIKVITVAPENVAPADIRRLVAAGVRVCLGHSNADFDTVWAALDAGATGFTHLFNAMSPLTSREPGMVGAALLDERSWCGLIVDNIHVRAESARIALRAKAHGKIMLVTDAMPPVGSDETEFAFFGSKVIRSGDTLRDDAGSLAGSVLDMASAVRNSIADLRCTPEEALRMASLYPAQFLGAEKSLGHLKVGARADAVLLDAQWQTKTVWRAGVALG